jgi:hypothetical protein
MTISQTITCNTCAASGVYIRTAYGSLVSFGIDPTCGFGCNEVRLWFHLMIPRYKYKTWAVQWKPPAWLRKYTMRLDRRYR